jgi:excisionase family DNA binding protein
MMPWAADPSERRLPMSPDTAPALDRCMSVGQLARYWRCRTATVRQMIQDGRLAAIHIGDRVRITPAAVAAAEAGLAVRPRVRRRRERIDPRVAAMLGDP